MAKVVILGGGFAGSRVARELEDDFDVTLIDEKDYFEFTPGILRTLVEPEHAKQLQAKHTTYLKKTKIIYGCAKKFDNEYVYYDGKKIKYDYLVIATGSTYNKPIKDSHIVITTRAKVLKEHSKQLKDANKILIVGGGYVGVELAAEIIDKFPKKEVTIVQSGDKLLARNTPKVQDYAEKWLRKRGVKITFNEKVKENKGKVYVTEKGLKIKTDLAFLCVGIKPNSEIMTESFPESVDEKHSIKVNSKLQVDGHSKIYAAGDVTNIKEEKTAQNAEKNADTIVQNIRLDTQGKELIDYESKPRIMVISLGKSYGIMTYKDKTLTGRIPGIMKNIIEWHEMKRYKR